jgi:hypothetical protein
VHVLPQATIALVEVFNWRAEMAPAESVAASIAAKRIFLAMMCSFNSARLQCTAEPS